MPRIAVSHPFNLRLSLFSHGWMDLPPFRWHEKRRALDAVISLRSGAPCAVRITSRRDNRPGQSLHVRPLTGRQLTAGDRRDVRHRLRWMFRLDEEFTEFHRACRRSKGFEWIARFGLGRFLRNASLFEEFVKVLLTTNVNWAGTRQMTARLMETLGEPVNGLDARGRQTAWCRAFPTPEAVAGAGEARLRRGCRLGYRAPYLLEFATAVAAGRLKLETFADPALDTDTLAKSLGRLKGFGPYAVNVLLMCFGRYERLALDSWIRKMVARRHFKSPRVSDSSIDRFYASWGEWRMLACWFDVMDETQLKPMVVEETALLNVPPRRGDRFAGPRNA